MIPVVEYFLDGLAVVALLPTLVLALQVLVALPRQLPRAPPPGRRPRGSWSRRGQACWQR